MMNDRVMTCPQPARLFGDERNSGGPVRRWERDSHFVGIEWAAFGGTELAEMKHLWSFNFHF